MSGCMHFSERLSFMTYSTAQHYLFNTIEKERLSIDWNKERNDTESRSEVFLANNYLHINYFPAVCIKDTSLHEACLMYWYYYYWYYYFASRLTCPEHPSPEGTNSPEHPSNNKATQCGLTFQFKSLC